MVLEFDYLREMLGLCVNPLAWILAFFLAKKGVNLGSILLGATACQILSVTLPYLIRDGLIIFSIQSTLLILLLSLTTGASIGFLVYGLANAGGSYRQLRQ